MERHASLLIEINPDHYPLLAPGDFTGVDDASGY